MTMIIMAIMTMAMATYGINDDGRQWWEFQFVLVIKMENDGNGFGDNNDKVDGNDAVVEYHVQENNEINHRLVWCW